MLVSQLIAAFEEIAPTRFAESWDNVGLIVGDPNQDMSAVMLTIDYTRAVASEAEKHQCNVIVAYHPPIFEGLKRIGAGSLIFDAIRRGVAIYSPHTALDVAGGGTNDVLADAVGMVDRLPLRLAAVKATQYKLITFVPEKDVQRVSDGLFEAGAGRIGNYTRCSFRSSGTGTFFGEEGTKPAVGRAGKFEETAEVRLETIVPIAKLAEILAALRRSHPYEEPALDLVQLAVPPEKTGQGRIGNIPPTPRPEIFARIKHELQLDHLLIAGPTEGLVSKVAVCAGACGDHVNDALAQSADLYLTGEMRHHDARKAADAGMTVVCTLHSNSERCVLKHLARRMAEKLPGLPIRVSETDRDPFQIA